MKHPWIGRRVLKTGLAVCLTTAICMAFNLSPTFAVISAIVTTEPTAADSLKKGLIRLPAAALGAFFAVLSAYFFGQTPITYAIVSMITIAVCARLRLDAGTLVATLTAVAMIPSTTDHLFADYVSRVAGTSLGIMISTFVNFMILPPKFGPILMNKVEKMFAMLSSELKLVTTKVVDFEKEETMTSYRTLHHHLSETYKLTTFQHDEWKYRKSSSSEKRSFTYLHRKLDYVYKALAHLGKIGQIRLKKPLSVKERQLVLSFLVSLTNILQDPLHQIHTEHYALARQLEDAMHKKKDATEPIHRLLSELISLHDLTVELEQCTADERRFSLEERAYPSYIFLERLRPSD
ncbi:aromatic acid exporter family protein [Halalkalibacterium halodurans]|nr:aromatic acid exporter family protein [Halalkalibacterium halodurans]MED3646312.1 aromatic acid exporter family protein [Halalkalibacterium halodurans]MED4079787.1 aromatic acid exporter family protein [Halalkalibacterium halodurans]MED4086271.1 aromatic acid exporter family protein [Halalkalibacterium halodurans]MED4103384.1 aromatic acid exporter family protein [Halalkalibacterium halodurans]MED4107919.1 aromatic acid exporter family protein [Halalkalibacterium halodurans]